jgi:hypothetical protein
MLMAGNTCRLFANIVFSFLAVGFFGWAVMTGSGMVFFGGLLGFLYSLHGLVLAVCMIDLPGPVLSAGRNGLVFSSRLTGSDLLPWDDVRNIRVIGINYPIWIPFATYLGVRTNRLSYFGGLARILPSSWLGMYFIPTRLLRGGGRSARQFVNVLERLREADRHDLASGGAEFMSESAMRWAMIRNIEFPIAKDGPPEAAMVGAVRDALLEEAGVHRDLLPETVRQDLLKGGSVKQLAAIGDG